MTATVYSRTVKPSNTFRFTACPRTQDSHGFHIASYRFPPAFLTDEGVQVDCHVIMHIRLSLTFIGIGYGLLLVFCNFV
jgi:hypothetical protein